MANGNATIIVGSARLGSARQEHSAVFFSVSSLISYQLPETGLIMSWLRLFEFAERAVV